MDSENIVFLSQRGCLISRLEKGLQIKIQIAYHLEVLQRRLLFEKFDANLIENLNKIQSVVNFDNGQTLRF